MSTTYIKQGATLPTQIYTIVDPNTSQILDLTGTSVYFHVGDFTLGDIVDSLATIVNATAGQVSYIWQPSDTAIAGTFASEWQVAYPGGATQTFPTDSYDTVIIYSDLSNGLTVPV